MSAQKISTNEDVQTVTKEDIQTNNKSVRVDKKAANVSMQVSSERARVDESKSVSCQNKVLKSVAL